MMKESKSMEKNSRTDNQSNPTYVHAGKITEWCILRDNPRLKRMLHFRAKEYGFNKLARDSGVEYRNMMAFLKGDGNRLSQRAVLRLCYHLKVKIKLDFEIDDDL